MVNQILDKAPENLFNDHQHLAEITLYRVLQNPRSVALSRSIEHEDLLQYAYMGLWRACLNYDSTKSKFQTHAIHNIRWGVMNGINRETSLIKYNVNNPPPEEDRYFIESIESGAQSEDGEFISRHEYIPSDVDIEADAVIGAFIEEMSEFLSERDKKIIHGKFMGKTNREIGKELKTSDNNVGRILNSIKKRLNKRKGDIK